MSLSVARPIVAESTDLGMAPDREGNNAWNIFVARFDTSGGLATAGDIWVRGAGCGGAAGPAPDIRGWGWGWKKLFGGGGELVGYGAGRPVLVLVGYMGCPGGDAPGYGRGAPVEVRLGWRPGC
jgi:hypothetical protein